jgi:hypothetical protein
MRVTASYIDSNAVPVPFWVPRTRTIYRGAYGSAKINPGGVYG